MNVLLSPSFTPVSLPVPLSIAQEVLTPSESLWRLWNALASEMGWNDESKLIHLECFLVNAGLMPVFLAYAKEAAREEVFSDDMDINESVLEVAEHVNALGKQYGFRQDADSVGGAVDESANLLSITLGEANRTLACERALALQSREDEREQGNVLAGVSKALQSTTGQLIVSVKLSDVVGAYEDATDLPDWPWLQSQASYVTAASAGSDPLEMVLNLSRPFENVPDLWVPVIENAKQLGVAYLLIHHGT